MSYDTLTIKYISYSVDKLYIGDMFVGMLYIRNRYLFVQWKQDTPVCIGYVYRTDTKRKPAKQALQYIMDKFDAWEIKHVF
jgi:hypothetical protein